jgi:tetratricopeptide (TPR) repeat protein
MNRAFYYSLFLGIVLLLNISCSQERTLSEVEVILESNPTAADSVLSSMSIPNSGRNRALYAILKTQADYKQYKSFTSDSLISIATSYYGTSRKDYHAAMAWYSQGCVYSDMQNDLAAIDAFIKAKELFPDTLVRYYALTEQYLGKHYLNQMMFDQSLDNLYGCLKNSLRLHDNVLTSNVRYLIALNSLYKAHYHEAESLFNVLLNDPQASSLRSRQCYLNLAKIYLHGYNDYTKAMQYIDRYLYELKNPAETGVGYSVKADIFFEAEQYDSAYLYYIRSMECQDELYTVCDNSGRLAILSVMRNNPDEAMQYIQLHDLLVDSIYDLRKDVALEEIIRSHQLALKENEDLFKHKRLIILSVSLLLLIILSYTLLISYKRNNLAKKQILQRDEARSNSIEIMKAHILDAPFNDRHISRESILNLYKEKLDMCKDSFRETQAYSILSSKLLNNDYSFEASEKTEIVNQISESFIDSILDMNIEISSLNREDIVICILSLLNFNNRFISAFINISESGVRKRKLRLLEKASKDYIDLFM